MKQGNAEYENYEQFNDSNILTIEKTEFNYFILLKNGVLLSILDNKLTTLGRKINLKSQIDQTIGKVEIKEKVVDVRCGNRHVLALTICGKVYSWGDYAYNQVNLKFLFFNFLLLIKLGHETVKMNSEDLRELDIELPAILPNRIKFFQVKIYATNYTI